MKRFFALCGGSLLTVLLLTAIVHAEEVSTPHFTMQLAAGWTVMQKSVAETDGKTKVAVRHNDGKTVVAIAVAELPRTASLDELFPFFSKQLEAGGVTVGEATTTGNTRMANFSRAGKTGTLYVTTSGKLFSAITMLGAADGSGKTFMRENFKPADAKLFPAAY